MSMPWAIIAKKALDLVWRYLNDPEAYKKAKERDRKRKEKEDAKKNNDGVAV